MEILLLLQLGQISTRGYFYGGTFLPFPEEVLCDKISVKHELNRLNVVLPRFFCIIESLSKDLLIPTYESNILIFITRILCIISDCFLKKTVAFSSGIKLKYTIDLLDYFTREKPLHIRIQLDNINMDVVDILFDSVMDCIDTIDGCIEDILYEFENIRLLRLKYL